MKSASKELGYPDLKPEQLDVLETFVKGHDLFAVLPTGYGKSLSLAAFPSTSVSSTQSYDFTCRKLLHSSRTKLGIGMRPDPRACALRCGFARLYVGKSSNHPPSALTLPTHFQSFYTLLR